MNSRIYQDILDISNTLDRSAALWGIALKQVPLIWGGTELLSDAPKPHSRPPAAVCRLPVEVIDLVIQDLDREELYGAALANKSLSAIATRVLYRSVKVTKPVSSVLCLRTLSRNRTLATLVRSFEIAWTSTIPLATKNLYDLANKALKNLVSLTSLTIDAKGGTWDFPSFAFSLQTFSTNRVCDDSLARFLDSQPQLLDLTLRGFSTGNLASLPLLGDSTAPTSFSLLPTSLPKLTALRIVHAGPAIVASVIKDRPVTQVSVPLYADCAAATLDALMLSTCDIKRLNIISFDPRAPDYLLKEVSQRFEALEALHAVILLARCDEVRSAETSICTLVRN